MARVQGSQQHREGDFALADGRLLDTGAPPEAPRLTFSGIGIYRPTLFAGITRGTPAKLAPLLRGAAAARRAGAERHLGRWVDVGTPQRLAQLDATLDASR